MFGRRKKRMAPPYDKAGKIPVIRSGICTGEQVAGFKDPETGKLIYRNVLARTQTECKTKLREATQDQYTNFLKKHLNPNIGDIPLEQLTSLRIQKMYQDLRTSGCIAQNKRAGTGLSQKTVRNIHMMLHVALDQAVKEGLLNKNPTDGCIPPKVEKKEMKVIQPEQIGAYLRAAEEHNVLPMFYLELTSGLRRGELLALLWSDLDVEQRTILKAKDGKLYVSAIFDCFDLTVGGSERGPGGSWKKATG